MSATKCDQCGCTPCETPGFCEACRRHEAELKVNPPPKPDLPDGWDTMSLPQLWEALNAPNPDRATQASCDAALHALRHGGQAALAQQSRRLSELSDRQIEALVASLTRLGAREELLLKLAELLP